MHQVVSSTAGIRVIEVPAPVLRPGHVLVEVMYSCVSTGSELAASASHQESLIRKLRSRPEKALAVWKLLRTSGAAAVKERLAQQTDEYRPLGYSLVGRVLDPGSSSFRPGDVVACAGAGAAVHAEIASVPQNLTCHVPETVAYPAASSVALGAIALQGVRQADVTPGCSVGVLGLGAIGQMVARLLVAAGCNAFVFDLDADRVATALAAHTRIRALPEQPTAEHPEIVDEIGGLDAVIIAASTPQPGLIDIAARWCRVRGRIVVLGDTPIAATRELLYAKELEIRLSCSYGPGRYDRSYEEDGIDYPPGHVRWTANRNMSAYLEAIAAHPSLWQNLWPEPTPMSEAQELFSTLAHGKKLLGVIAYPPPVAAASGNAQTVRRSSATTSQTAELRVGVIGAGEFVRLVHLPNLAANPLVQLASLATRTSLTGERLSRQYGFSTLSSDAQSLIADANVDAIVIGVRHREHGSLVINALRAGKHVFVEKPLALTESELDEIQDVLAGTDRILMVGFNRRFSSLAPFLRCGRPGASLHYRFAAGTLPPQHWVNGPEGGGRLVGEACHAIDFVEYALGPISEASFAPTSRPASGSEHAGDGLLTLRGTFGAATITYASVNPPRGIGKERIELSANSSLTVLDDFVHLTRRGGDKRLRRPDKGHRACLDAFIAAAIGREPAPISYDSLLRTSRLAVVAQAAADAGVECTWRRAES